MVVANEENQTNHSVLLIAVLVTGGYFVYTAKQTEGVDAKRTEILYDC